jgi:hypothetical protein
MKSILNMSTENVSIKEFWCPEYSYKCIDLSPSDRDDLLCPNSMYLFPAACRYLIDGMEFCDEPPSPHPQCECFGPRDRCCIYCYPCLSPIGLAVDLITLPFRSIYCVGYKTHKCCSRSSAKNTSSDENTSSN